MSCPACGRDHDLDGLSYQPPAAFGRFAIVTADIEAAALGAEAMVWAREHLGARVRTVWRR